MGKTSARDGPSAEFCQRVFHDHYRINPPTPPPGLKYREFARVPFDFQGMMRHEGFTTPESMVSSFLARVPRHLYYSTAYYEHPEHPIMVSKGWLGADLIFDIDADHLTDPATGKTLDETGMSFPDLLERAKQEMETLLEFVFEDFGIDEEDAAIAFSGGRGYHCHVHREAFRTLDSAARRELVEYVAGRPPLNLADYTDPKNPHLSDLEKGGGWPARFAKNVVAILSEWVDLDYDSLKAVLKGELGLTDKREVAALAKGLSDGGVRKILENRIINIRGATGPMVQEFTLALQRKMGVDFSTEVDAPVTTDIHRLIRLPGSLHGGTGFRVVKLARSELHAFDPMKDALINDGGRLQKVRLTTAADWGNRLGGVPIMGHEGKELELPYPQALFLLLRGEAVVA